MTISDQEVDLIIKLISVLVLLTGLNLVALINYGTKIIRFFSRIEWRTNLMWVDFARRTGISDGETK